MMTAADPKASTKERGNTMDNVTEKEKKILPELVEVVNELDADGQRAVITLGRAIIFLAGVKPSESNK